MGQSDVIMAGLDAHCEQEIVRLTSEIHATLTEDTPIDIGWARAGWVPSIGRPYSGGADLDPDGAQVSIALGRAAQGQAELVSYNLADGDTFVTNNVPYIQRLNEGWSA